MKPAPFEYFAPATLDEALSLLAQYEEEAKALAGGQSLIPAMNFRLARPAVLIDLNRLAELDFVHRNDDGELCLGAMTRQSRIERDPLVVAHDPVLHEVMPHVAHPQIRNRGTVGGSLAHADPAAELPVVAVARGARFRLRRRDDERWVRAVDFYQGLFETDLQPDELVVEIRLPPFPGQTGHAFLEVARRHGDYALAGVLALVSVAEGGRCQTARLVYLNVGDKPTVAARAAAMLVGETPGPDLWRAVAETATAEEMEPAGDIHASAGFKRHLARVLTERALQLAWQRARAATPDPPPPGKGL